MAPSGQRSLGAISALLVMLAACSRGEQAAQRHLQRATVLMERGDLAQAEEAFARALAAHPSARAHHGLGVTHELRGQFGPALEAYRKAITLAPEDASPRIALTRALALSGDLSGARAAAAEMRARAPDDYEVVLLLAALATDDAELDELQKQLQRLLDLAGVGARGRFAELALARADLYERRGSPADAQAQRAAADRHELRNPTRALVLAEVHRKQGHHRTARDLLLRVVAIRPNLVPAALSLIDASLAISDLDAARAALASLQGAQTERHDVLIARARVALAERAPERAEAMLAQALQRLPEATPPEERNKLRLLLAKALLAQQRDADAERELTQLVGTAPELAAAQLMLSDVELRANHAQRALARLTRLAAQHPGDAEVAKALARSQLAAGEPALAVRTYEALLAQGARDPEVAYGLGLSLFERGERDRAVQHFEHALVLAPGMPGPVKQLLALDRETGGPGAAERRLRAQLAVTPRSVPLLTLLAEFLREHRRLDEAERAYEEAIAAHPSDASAHFRLAQFLADSGQLDRALAAFQRGLAHRPGDIDALTQVAQLSTRADDADKARTAYEHVLRARPEFVPALNNLAMLYLDVLGDPSRGLEFAQRAAATAPALAAVTDTLGWAHHKTGDNTRAVELLEHSTPELDTPSAHFHLGMARIAAGQKVRGKAALRAALAKSSNFPEADLARAALSSR